MEITATTLPTAAASGPPPNTPPPEATDAPARPTADATVRPGQAPESSTESAPTPPARSDDGLDAATRVEMQDRPQADRAPDPGREGPPQGLSDATARAAEEGYAKAGPATVPEPAAPADIGLNLVA